MGGWFSSPSTPDNSAQIAAMQQREREEKEKAMLAQKELTEKEKARSRKRRGLAFLIGTSELGVNEDLG